MSLLETRSLSIGYTQKATSPKVLQKDVNLSINPGEIISLMGQNGVGKTTFVKTISGLIPRLSGEVYYHHDPLEHLNANEVARRLSIVLTEKPYSHNISVLELIAIGRHPYSNWMGVLSDKDKKAIDWAINETHINYLADKKLYELSDGQLQKVMIARALAQETDLIILDEPAAHLDLYNKIEVMTLLRSIAQKGKGILISTHDMQISTQLSDRLWLFNFNEPVQQGTPEDLILDGTLEKTLYLQDYGYDMIHGSINIGTPENGTSVKLEGPEAVLFWTSQALRRNGIKVSESAETIVSCSKKEWIIRTPESSKHCTTIGELLAYFRQAANPGSRS